MKKIQCPCCGYYTIDSSDEVIVEICEVCFWQYDWVAHQYPDKAIGPNRVSLVEARKNYKLYGVSELRFMNTGVCRKPYPDELDGNE